ncbi:MAG TPA: TIGR00296 family protein [Nitrososphaera sp.]|nr:TIGR00296 family protein [Nitrososphaera sp.]
MISDAEGAELVRLARLAVEKYVNESIVIKGPVKDLPKSGVFVTMAHYYSTEGNESLRGCIGFPLPYKGLRQSVVEAAIAAATQDPRFPPIIDGRELGQLVFEVSVLTEPEEIMTESPDERKQQIKVGRDGLLLKWEHGSGLLLPQVPIELGWDVDEYLANICYKAGAPHDAWLDPRSKLFTFQAAIFKEEKPGGNVVRLDYRPDNDSSDDDDNNK